jgi:hypothetical protein
MSSALQQRAQQQDKKLESARLLIHLLVSALEDKSHKLHTVLIQMFGVSPKFELPPNGNPIDLEVGCPQYRKKCDFFIDPSPILS